MAPRFESPAINKTSFNCPHCGTLAHQTWWKIFAKALDKGIIPTLYSEEQLNEILKKIEDDEELKKDKKDDLTEGFSNLKSQEPFLKYEKTSSYNLNIAHSTWISSCYNCNKPTIWIYDKIIWPKDCGEIIPNYDLPANIQNDFKEASTILNLSPRGAAALLRLSIQKICGHLGETGKNLNADIANLVKKGLDVRIQQALDLVRVIGNHAVHPGQIDLRDDRETASKLFDLVNLIADAMISQPNRLNEMFENLPQNAKDQIRKRDNDNI